ncbi:MAG: CoB--CoM heterodisulfide reductase iron-sulfur subunit A family protein [Candidatus Kapabacteria bacterium]|nr:CoB--CoM heterodisulfide reductase iron-sulfur subunit A family protein [Candidatus Kapabacteria bacterium]
MEKTNGQIRIGFYICHCGTNIASSVDVQKVTDFAATLPNVVVAKHYKYMCSDPGQDMIINDIKEQNLNRVVVAACSPFLHERTFRNATFQGGLNQFYFQMVNTREQNAWVHLDPLASTDKAIDLVRAAVQRVASHKPLEQKKVPIHPDVLVIGGGIAGIHAALTLGNAGKKVYLVEKEPTIGGHMAMFDKTFPTLDCAACILTPKMSAVKNHPNIKLCTYSEVEKIDGYVGNFKVTIKHKPRFIIDDLCVGCMDCVEACVYKEARFPDEFNQGLSRRKPVYMPFPQATPQLVLIDPETCIWFKSGKCKKTCVDACERKAVDLEQQARVEEVEVGSIVVATGFQPFDSKKISYYGYGNYPNVYTSLEVERLINASGPTQGVVVLRDGSHPKTIGIVHCVGSRDKNTNSWCSRVCCLYSVKLAHLLKEHTGAEIYNFYIDMRTPGKSMEEFYNRIAEEGMKFIRGRVADIYPDMSDPDHKKLIMKAEDTLIQEIIKVPVDMVVLSVGLEPRHDAQQVRRMLNISCSTEGFYIERHPKLAPVSTFTDGIFLAGCCQGPKDIPDTVAQAGAAAAEVLALIDRGFIELEPNTAFITEEECSGCKSCIHLCPYTAISFLEEKKKAFINEALCKGCGTCVAACPSGSIKQNLFDDEEIYSEIDGILNFDHISRELSYV